MISMAGLSCTQCGAPIDSTQDKCPYCGSAIEHAAPPQYQAAPDQAYPPIYPAYPLPPGGSQDYYTYDGINMSWPIRNKTTAALLAIFLGCFGVHKFYLGKTGAGVLYLFLTFTTFLAPFVFLVSVTEGVMFLAQKDHDFQIKNKVRLK